MNCQALRDHERSARRGRIWSARPRWQGTSVGLAWEPGTASSQLLLWEAIDPVRAAAEGPELLLDDLAEWMVALLIPSLSLQQNAAEQFLGVSDRMAGEEGNQTRACLSANRPNARNRPPLSR